MMEVMYDFLLYLMGALLVFALCVHIYANVLGTNKATFCVTETNSDLLYEELVSALNRTGKRCKFYKTAHYTLTVVNIIGGVSISTVFINEVLPCCMGFAGFLVLISSLLILILRPEEKLYRTKSEIAFLKKTKNKYDSMSDDKRAKTYLRNNLNEFEERQSQ